MDSRSNLASTNVNHGDFTGATEQTQQQPGTTGASFGQQNQKDHQSPNAPHHHLHKDNEPIGQKQYDPDAAAAFSQSNVDELSSNQTTSYRPNVDVDEDHERAATDVGGTGDEQHEHSEQRKTGGIGARLTGKVEQMTGKYTHNPLKEAAGLDRQSSATKDEAKADALEQLANDVRSRASGGV